MSTEAPARGPNPLRPNVNNKPGSAYSVKLLGDDEENSRVRLTLGTAAVLGGLLSPFLLLAPSVLGEARLLPLVILFGAYFALERFLLGQNKNAFLILLAASLLLGLGLFFAATDRSQSSFHAITLGLVLAVVSQIALHFAALRRTAPVPSGVADQLAQHERDVRPLFRLQLLLIAAWTIVCVGPIHQMFHNTPLAPWAGSLSIATLAITLLFVPFVASFFCGQHSSPFDMLVGTRKAIRSYLNYGRRSEEGVDEETASDGGGFESPAGLFPVRERTVIVAVVAIATTLFSIGNFFPLSRPPQEAFDWNRALSIKPESHDAIEEYKAVVHTGDWIAHCFFQTPESNASWASGLASLGLCFTVPPVMFLVYCFSATGNHNGYYYRKTKEIFGTFDGSDPGAERGLPEPPPRKNNMPRQKNAWDALVDAQIDSHPEYIYIGRRKRTGTPLSVHDIHFKNHAHILGGSGRGKTALALAPLVSQFIRRGDCNVIVFDLKYHRRDRSFFENTQIEADEAGLDFKFFTTAIPEPTHLCNPFYGTEKTHLDLEQRGSILVDALGMLYGKKYGEAYFSEVAIRLGRLAYSKLIDPDSPYQLLEPVTFPKLLEALRKVKEDTTREDDKLTRDAATLESVLEKYAMISTVNYDPDSIDQRLAEGAIRFADLFRTDNKPQVYFFGLSAEDDPERSGGLTRLFLNQIMKLGTKATNEARPTFVIIDEFQFAAAPSFQRLLEQARSAEVGLILANQSISAIEEAGGKGLMSAMWNNIAFRQVFQLLDPEEMSAFETVSGTTEVEEVVRNIRRDVGSNVPTAITYQMRVTEADRFPRSEWIKMNAQQFESVAFATFNKGETQESGFPIHTESDYHISEKEFEIRKSAALPEVTAARTTALAFSKILAQKNTEAEGPRQAPQRWSVDVSHDPED